MGIRKILWPDDKGRFRPSLLSLSKVKELFLLQTLKNVRMLDVYSSTK